MKQKNLKLAVMALCSASMAQAQTVGTDSIGQRGAALSESAFTFTEAQLGEDDDMSQNVTIVNSNSNMYARLDSSSRRCVSVIVRSTRSITMFISTDCR